MPHRPAFAACATLATGALLAAFAAYPAHAAVPTGERGVLDALYAQTGGASWTTSTGWESASDECSWFGITCDADGLHVVGIELSGNNLMGTLPDITALSALQQFDVDTNRLQGSVPAITSLTDLQVFNVAENQLTGSIPSLDGLTSLQHFSVEDNALSGTVPGLGSLVSIVDFEIGGNALTGLVPDPPPAPATQVGGSLCSNHFDPPSVPESASDLYWDIVVDSNSWYEGCAPAPAGGAPAIPAPALSLNTLLLLIGLFATAGCAWLIRRTESLRRRT